MVTRRIVEGKLAVHLALELGVFGHALMTLEGAMLLRGGQVNAFDGKGLEMMGGEDNVPIQGLPQYFFEAVVVVLHHACLFSAVL